MFISLVSLFLKALLVKARSRVFGTEISISPIYLLTRVSIYRESHPQFRSPRDLLTKVNCFMLLAYLQIYRGISPLQFAPFPPFGIAEGLHGLKR